MNASCCCSRVGLGIALTVATITLAAITAIALAVIFAPPFFATALLGSYALHIAIGCGIGAAILGLFTLLVLREEKTQIAPRNSDQPIGEEQIDAYLEKVKQCDWPEKEYGGKSFPANFEKLLNDVRNHPNKEAHKKAISDCLNTIQLCEDGSCHNINEIYNKLNSLLQKMNEEEAAQSNEVNSADTTQDSDETSSQKTDISSEDFKKLTQEARNYIKMVKDNISTEKAGQFTKIIETIFDHPLVNDETFSRQLIKLLKRMDTTTPFSNDEAENIYNNLFVLYDNLCSEEESRSLIEARTQLPPKASQYLDAANNNHTTTTANPKTIKKQIKELIRLIGSHPHFEDVEDDFNAEVAKLDLSKDPKASKALTIYNGLKEIADNLDLLDTDE